MLNASLADKFIKDELRSFNDVNTLRDLFATMFDVDNDDNSIEDYLNDDISDMLEIWADDNSILFGDMFELIMDNLDTHIKLNIEVDRDYDVKPKDKFKEVRFTGSASFNDVILDLDEWYDNMPMQ